MTVGSRLINHPGMDMFSLAEDVATRGMVIKAASAGLKQAYPELGGKTAVVVLDDADLN